MRPDPKGPLCGALQISPASEKAGSSTDWRREMCGQGGENGSGRLLATALKDVDMSTGVAVADWIKRLVDEERTRDAVRAREEETAARKADLVRVHGQRLIDELRTAVTRDIEAFRNEFAGDRTRDIVLEPTEPEGGFVVRNLASPAVSLAVEPHLEAATMGCPQ